MNRQVLTANYQHLTKDKYHMSRKNIEIGNEVNDGLGDSLRTGAIKINENFSEIYSKIGDGNDILLSIDFSTLPVEGQTLYYNQSTSKFEFNDTLQGTRGLQGIQGPSGQSIQGIQGITGQTGSTGIQGIQGITGQSIQGIQGITGNTIVFTRTTVSGSTTLINNGDSQNISIDGFKSYVLFKIETNDAAWVRLYSDNTSRTNDSSRSQSEDPLPGAGIIAEVITTGEETVLITPGSIGFSNENTPTNNIPVSVTNLSGITKSITVNLTILRVEN
jgi:hypothetical protein